MLLVIDNYDSFVHNLARYFRRLELDTTVVRNDQIAIEDIARIQPEAVIISPGPCGPRHAGISLEVVRRFMGKMPILGVCLGHQVIVEALGGTIMRAAQPRHGQASWVEHDRRREFAGLDSPLQAGRYHSLIADWSTLPECLEVSAYTREGELSVIMGVRHRTEPIFGWQFHPESILTPEGDRIIETWCREVRLLRVGRLGAPTAASGPPMESQLPASQESGVSPPWTWPNGRAVSF